MYLPRLPPAIVINPPPSPSSIITSMFVRSEPPDYGSSNKIRIRVVFVKLKSQRGPAKGVCGTSATRTVRCSYEIFVYPPLFVTIILNFTSSPKIF